MVISKMAERLFYIRSVARLKDSSGQPAGVATVGYYCNVGSEAEAFEHGSIVEKILNVLEPEELKRFVKTGIIPDGSFKSGM